MHHISTWYSWNGTTCLPSSAVYGVPSPKSLGLDLSRRGYLIKRITIPGGLKVEAIRDGNEMFYYLFDEEDACWSFGSPVIK